LAAPSGKTTKHNKHKRRVCLLPSPQPRPSMFRRIVGPKRGWSLHPDGWALCPRLRGRSNGARPFPPPRRSDALRSRRLVPRARPSSIRACDIVRFAPERCRSLSGPTFPRFPHPDRLGSSKATTGTLRAPPSRGPMAAEAATRSPPPRGSPCLSFGSRNLPKGRPCLPSTSSSRGDLGGKPRPTCSPWFCRALDRPGVGRDRGHVLFRKTGLGPLAINGFAPPPRPPPDGRPHANPSFSF